MAASITPNGKGILRKKAEDAMASRPAHPEESPAQKDELIHELEVHQMELEMQNDELRLTQGALEDSHKKITDLYEFAPVGYLSIDSNGIIVEANLTAAKLLTSDRRTLIDKPFAGLIHRDDQDIVYMYMRSLRSGPSQTCEVRIVSKGSLSFHAQLVGVPFAAGADAQRKFLVAVFDISDRKRAEEQLALRVNELAASNKELESFSYSISHDLRAPLRAIKGFSRILVEDFSAGLTPEAQDLLGRIGSGADRMSQLIDDLLSLAKISRQELQVRQLDLGAMAGSIVSELRQSEPGRQVDAVIASELPGYGDERLMRIALSNLIGNAWKYTSKKPDARIEVGAAEVSHERVFYVRDNGVGFDMAHAHKLFAPFHRLHADREFAGTGIGLCIVNSIMLRHGGRIWVEAAVGTGATFFFALQSAAANTGGGQHTPSPTRTSIDVASSSASTQG